MSNFEVNSTRMYSVTGFVRGTLMSSERVPLGALIKNSADQEFIYALQEELDSILDLQVGLVRYINLDRDDPESRGVILRVK